MKDDQQEIENLIKQNIELTKDLQKQIKSVRRYLLWQRIAGIFYLIIIIGPIIIGLIYLPPLIKNAIGPYQSLLEGVEKVNGLDINSIINGINR